MRSDTGDSTEKTVYLFESDSVLHGRGSVSFPSRSLVGSRGLSRSFKNETKQIFKDFSPFVCPISQVCIDPTLESGWS